MRKKQRSSIIFRVALILFCLVLFSSHLSSGILAKYKIEGTGSNTAKVAQPDITVASAQSAPTIAADGSATYTFTVTNSGETAVSYSLLVSFETGTLSSDDVDLAFSNVKLDGVSGTYDSSSYAFVFADLGALEPDADPASHTLTFDTNDFVITDSSITNSNNSYKTIKVLITAKAVQID